jgi:hypothetical protein
MFSPAHLFLMLNAIEFPEASSRAVEHYYSIRRGARLISARHLRDSASRQEALRAAVIDRINIRINLLRCRRTDRSVGRSSCALRCDRPTHRRASLRASVSSDARKTAPRPSLMKLFKLLSQGRKVEWSSCESGDKCLCGSRV